MYNAEVVSTRIKPTEETTLAKLSMLDQLKLLFSKFSSDDAAELDAAEKLSVASLRMKASLTKLIETAIKEMNKNNKNSFVLAVSSEYLPYLDDVIGEEHGLGQFYKFTVFKKDLPVNVKYKMFIQVERKVT